MDPIDSAIEILTIWGKNFRNNFYGLLELFNPYNLVDAYNNPSNVDWVRWIRLVALIGGYILLSGWLRKHAAKKQERDLAKQDANEKEPQKATISANALRGFEEKNFSFEDEDASEEEAKATGNEPQWGKKARKRQRQVVKKLLEMQEEKLRLEQEDDEDKDIMEFLVDYEEGKDGW